MKNTIKNNKGIEKYITNLKGDIEFVVLPIETYQEMIDLIEDYGLGLAMQKSKNDTVFEKVEAEKYLANDKS